jgi:hypothetical protein
MPHSEMAAFRATVKTSIRARTDALLIQIVADEIDRHEALTVVITAMITEAVNLYCSFCSPEKEKLLATVGVAFDIVTMEQHIQRRELKREGTVGHA